MPGERVQMVFGITFSTIHAERDLTSVTGIVIALHSFPEDLVATHTYLELEGGI